MDAQSEFSQALSAFFAALARAEVSDEASRRAGEAFAAYGDAVQRAWPAPDDHQRALEAYQHYTGAVADAWASDELAERAAEAYRAYVGALRAVWTDVDERAIDPTTLATIASEMQMVGWWGSLVAARNQPETVGGGG